MTPEENLKRIWQRKIREKLMFQGEIISDLFAAVCRREDVLYIDPNRFEVRSSPMENEHVFLDGVHLGSFVVDKVAMVCVPGFQATEAGTELLKGYED